MSEVPDRSNDPRRKATFQCEECGKIAPIHEAGVDAVCNNCFDNRYGPDFECTHEKADGSGMCDYVAQGRTKSERRNDLDRHFDQDPEHSADYDDEDESSNLHSSFAPEPWNEQDEDAYWANQDNDQEDPRNPRSNGKGKGN